MIKNATFGAGCFWCVETCFKDIKGVLTVIAGFCGGDPERSSYEEVCSGTTGHAEVARVQFDDSIVTFDKLLEMFWYAHDPTQLNRQGNDIGSHYRSVIFYHSDEQKDKAQFAMSEFTRNEIWPKPVVTEISPVSTFFPADDYHKDYYSKNSDNMYCNLVLRPKVEKFKEVFRDLLK